MPIAMEELKKKNDQNLTTSEKTIVRTDHLNKNKGERHYTIARKSARTLRFIWNM